MKEKKALDIGSGKGRIVSYLVEKGYDVTAVDLNRAFCENLQREFPSVRVLHGDIRALDFDGDERFDLTTCIELVQNLDKNELLSMVTKLSTITKQLLINISNKNSFHAFWVRQRGWQKSFVFTYTPRDFEHVLRNAGFDITYARGVGLITPVSLFKEFRGKLIPIWLAQSINKFDFCFNSFCHAYQKLYGQDFTILRYGIPCGPKGGRGSLIANFVKAALDKEPLRIFGDGSQYRNFIYVEDLAAGNAAVLHDAAVNQTYNLEGIRPVTVKEVAETIKKLVPDVTVEYQEARPGDYSGAVASGGEG